MIYGESAVSGFDLYLSTTQTIAEYNNIGQERLLSSPSRSNLPWLPPLSALDRSSLCCTKSCCCVLHQFLQALPFLPLHHLRLHNPELLLPPGLCFYYKPFAILIFPLRWPTFKSTAGFCRCNILIQLKFTSPLCHPLSQSSLLPLPICLDQSLQSHVIW